MSLGNSQTRGNADAYDVTQGTAYRHYTSDSVYVYDPGVLLLPVASETPKTATVRMHGGHGLRTVKFKAMKNGNPPILPAANSTVKDVLVGAKINLPMPETDPTNNGYVWSAEGEYTYVTIDDPRIPGRDYFPTTARPYYTSQDSIAIEMLRGTDLDSIKNNIRSQDFDRGTYRWAFTVMPDTFFNPNLIY